MTYEIPKWEAARVPGSGGNARWVVRTVPDTDHPSGVFICDCGAGMSAEDNANLIVYLVDRLRLHECAIQAGGAVLRAVLDAAKEAS